MREHLPYILPAPQPQAEDTFAVYQTTHQFYFEVQKRSAFERHCEWYYKTAEQHRKDLKRMRGEVNIFSWFRRSSKI